MKTRLLAVLISISALVSFAQVTNTNAPPVLSGPAAEGWQFLTASASNWIVAPYGVYDTTTKKWGAGLGVGYKVSEFVVPTMRIDALDTVDGFGIWMPSASLQLQAPVRVMNTVTVVPFAFAGIATSISGGHDENGSVVGIFGVGGAVRLGTRWDLLADYEVWTGGPFHSDNQIRVGFGWKPKAW